MKVTYCDMGAHARIWITGPFWQLRKAQRIADSGSVAAPLLRWESKGLTFQITLSGTSAHALRGYKAIVRAMA